MHSPGEGDQRVDEELIAAMNRGDAAAFGSLYARYRDWVAALALRFTGDRDEALDVIQETFAYFLGKFPGFELRARLTTFLYPAVKNIAVRLRDKRRRAALPGDLPEIPCAFDPATTAGDRAELAAALSALPPPQLEVVLLRFVDDLALEEIAAALAIPAGTVKSRLHAALATLRQDARARRYLIGE